MNKKQSLRAFRRKAERKQQEESHRRVDAIMSPKSFDERKKMLEKAIAECEEKARTQAVDYTFRCIYAAVLLASQEVYGFGRKRAWRLIKRVDEIVCTTLDTEEIIQQVWEKMGLEINFREGVDRIREVDA